MKEGTVQRIIARNLKAIEDFDAAVNGDSLIIFGGNDVGKSTILQAIQAIHGNKKLLKELTVRQGTEAGYFETVESHEGQTYRFRINLEKGKDPELLMYRPNGTPIKTDSIIAKVAGGAPFNIWEFVNWAETAEGRRKQVALAEDFLTADQKEVLNSLRAKVEEHYKQRTEIGRDLDSIRGFVAKSEISEADFDKYKAKIDIDLIQETLSKAIKNNEKITYVTDGIERRKKEIEDIDAQIKVLLEKKETALEEITKGEEFLKVTKVVDTDQYTESIQLAQKHNDMVSKVESLKEYKIKRDNLETEYENLGIFVNSSRAEIEHFVKEIGFPVEGLEFGIDHLIYKGFPVDDMHLSFSERTVLGVKIHKALQPEFPVILVENSESLGKKKYEALLDLRKEGFQLILEHMERSVEQISYKIIPE
jgi:predicted ATP-dependent endonuclease of OLD family